MTDLNALFRPAIQAIAGYVPGEQPQTDGWVKLNTNELPYPPSPKAIEAMRAAASDRLRIYPDPLGRDFCNAVADRYGIGADMVLPGNGSDDCLTILVRSFLDADRHTRPPVPIVHPLRDAGRDSGMPVGTARSQRRLVVRFGRGSGCRFSFETVVRSMSQLPLGNGLERRHHSLTRPSRWFTRPRRSLRRLSRPTEVGRG